MKVNGHWVPCVRNSSYSLMPIRLKRWEHEFPVIFSNEVMLLTQIKAGCTLTRLPRHARDVDRIKQFTNRLRLSNSMAIPGDKHCSAAI